MGRARGGKRVPATWVVTILAIAVLRTFFLHDRLLPHPWSWIGYGVVGLVVLRAIDLHNKQIERSE